MLVKLVVVLVGAIVLTAFQNLLGVETIGPNMASRIAVQVATMLFGVAIWNADNSV